MLCSHDFDLVSLLLRLRLFFIFSSWLLLLISIIFKSSLLYSLAIVFISFTLSKPKLLSFMVNTHALRILIQPSEASALLIWPDAFHFNNLCSAQDISKLDGASLVFLVLDDIINALCYWISLCYSFIVHISFVCILVATYN